MFLGSRLDKKLIEIKNSHGCAIDWYEYFVEINYNLKIIVTIFIIIN